MEETTHAQRKHATGALLSDLFGSGQLARLLWLLSLALVVSTLLLEFLTPDFLLPAHRPTAVFAAASCLLSLAASSVGTMVASRLPRNPVGWIFCGMGLVYGAWSLAEAYADYALLVRPGLPLGEVAAWTSTWFGFPILIALAALVVLLFPDGTLLSPRWRVIALATGGGAVLVTLGDALRSGPLLTYYYVNNPFGIRGTVGGVLPATSLAEAAGIVGGALLSAGCLASIVALVLRLRLAYGPERRYLEWFAYAAVPALLCSTVVLLHWSVERFGLLFLGRTLTPTLEVAGNFAWFAKLGQTAGTLTELRLDANLEFLSACALLMMPICAYVGMHYQGLFRPGEASPAAARWLRALFGGTIAGAMPIGFVYLAVFLYVVFYPLGGRGELGQEQLARVVAFVGGSGAQAFFFAATFLVAFLLTRKEEERAVLFGTLVGLVAASTDRTLASIIDPPLTPAGVASYVCLGLAGGYFGGLMGRSTLSGSVYRISRQIGKAKGASAVAAAIGENLGDTGVEGVALWRRSNIESQDIPVDAHGSKPRRDHGPHAMLWGSWRAAGQEGWPSGLDPGETGAAMLVAPGERSWAAVQRRTLMPGEQRSWEQSGVGSSLLIPLIVPEEAWRGLLMITFRKRSRFSGRAARAYLTVASQAALALENLRLIEEARQAGRQGGILLERQRLAREIHDTLAQGFTGVITNLTAAELTTEPPAMNAVSARYVEDAKRIARDSLAEARSLVWALRPESLDRYSLPEALSRLVLEWSEQTGIEAHGTTKGTPRELLPEAEVALLRAAQESLTNVHKHARASKVNVTLTYMDDRAVIDVLDDGDGFDPAAITTAIGPQDERGFGLTAMRERVEQLGGRLAVETAPGEGTAIVVELRDTRELGALEETR